MEFNAVAGCSHFGYWYRLANITDEPEFLNDPNFCPHRQPFGSFVNNSVHSTGRFGVWIYPEYAPTISGNCTDPRPSQANIEGLISWKNNKGIELVMSRTIQVRNMVAFDNAYSGVSYITAVDHQNTNPTNLRPTFYDADIGSSLIDSVIIGDANISSVPLLAPAAGLVGE